MPLVTGWLSLSRPDPTKNRAWRRMQGEEKGDGVHKAYVFLGIKKRIGSILKGFPAPPTNINLLMPSEDWVKKVREAWEEGRKAENEEDVKR